jgi:hypothetical protein
MRKPFSSECFHTGTFHSIRKSGPPNIVDQNIQTPLLALETRDQTLDLHRVQMIDLHGDPLAASLPHQVGRLLNRFGTVILGTLRARGATREVYRGSSRAQLDSDAAARAARCPCDQRHFALEYLTHHPTLSGVYPRILAGARHAS